MWTELGESAEPQSVLDYIPLEKRILWLIESALSSGPVMLEEILRRIFTSLKNGRTPQNQEILNVLDASCVQMPNGAWRLRTSNDSAIQLALGSLEASGEERVEAPDDLTHDQFVKLVAEWAPHLGFTPYVGRTERRGNPALRPIGVPNLMIPGIDQSLIRENRTDEIDVVWLKDGTLPVALFEIEHTTRAMTCIPRLGNLTHILPHLALDVFIVGPDSLQRQVERQLRAPSGAAVVRDHPSRWYFLPYSAALSLQDHLQERVGSLTLQMVRDASIALTLD
jgi:hypothetical protein